MSKEFYDKVKKHSKKSFDNVDDKYSFDLDGTDSKKDEEIDYRAIAEEFQRKIYNLEKIIRENNLEDQLERQITDEEFICMNGIDSIRTLVFNKTFTKDDINMFDVLYRNLNVIRGIKGSNQKKEKPKSHAELLQLVKKQ
jgi:aryl carrier-like protein